MKRIAFVVLPAALFLGCDQPPGPSEPIDTAIASDGPAFAHTGKGKGILTEPAWYDGQIVHFVLPAGNSNTDNVQVVADCFRVGPAVPDNVPINGTVWVLAVPGAWQETTCSTDGRDAGDLTHNHVFSVAPGDPEYNGKFQIVLVLAGNNYPGAAFVDDFNSAAAVLAGIAAGELTVAVPNVARVNWSVQK